MISEDKIEKNKKKFLEINEQYEIFTPELQNYLGEDFFLAPASPTLDKWGAYPGGLVDHLMIVCKYAVKTNDLLPESIRIDKKTIIRTTFLSQIGKTFLFKLNDNEWFIKNKGKMYEYRDDEMVLMNVGERSIFYATKYGVELSEIEFQAILNIDKDPSERFVRKGSELLFHLLKIGFDLAVLEEKYGKK